MTPLRYWSPIVEDVKLEKTTVSSTMLSMLPASLQSRLPPLRSVRKSVSMQTLQTTMADRRSPSHGPTRTLSDIDAVPMTPPSAPADKIVSDSHQLGLDDPNRTPPPEYPSTPLVAQSGVQWRYAQQGLSLLHVAQAESRHPLSRNASGPDLERKAFLDGAEYILKSLPDDLSKSELERLRASAPSSFTSTAGANTDPFNCAYSHRPDSPYQWGHRPGHRHHHHYPSDHPYGLYPHGGGTAPPKSILHRIVQAAVVQLFILAHMALPYVILLLRMAARTEREYKVSQNVLAAGLGLANAVGTNGLRVTASICGLGDGRVGQALGDVVAWAVEGLTAGLTEGVGEGLSIVGGSYKGDLPYMSRGWDER